MKTRKKREKTGKEWARYGLKSVNKERQGGINWARFLPPSGLHSFQDSAINIVRATGLNFPVAKRAKGGDDLPAGSGLYTHHQVRF